MVFATVPGNLFSPRFYVTSDPKSGLLSTPTQRRLIAVPSLLIDSIYETLQEEAGQASFLALYTFGRAWGKSFWERAQREIETYYHSPIANFNAIEFFALMQELWAVHGLGKITTDFSRMSKGMLLVTVRNSSISQGIGSANPKSYSLEAGFLAGWFSGLTEKQLAACAVDWKNAPAKLVYAVASEGDIEKWQSKSTSV
ncbi:MAG: hypothetical protein RMK91_04550 [Pseudanabaenaceae cyanobacterium SKYGB_i_bin29]|nr:hypothetical protein [Pseudanabaenaceae cyanobacterium SKYG29]MDW8421114.1 hypothetical protein [Pseudanabaenaceae cyanobacterium SKYGB_i_bin29]